MRFVRRVHRQAALRIVALVAFAATLVAGTAAAQEPRKVAIASFGLFGGQDVFRSEATGAAEIAAHRFGGNPVIVRFNSRKGADATVANLAASLETTARKMDPRADVLLLILTSHGSPNGLAVTTGRKSATLTPGQLGSILDHVGVAHKAVIISACYSGVFIPRLANDDTLMITAADANHPSFGCEDGAKWTYFGDAFFNVALRRTTTLREAFMLARGLVSQREKHNGFEPSNPQMAGGANVEPLLVARK
jgi:hypothetical protein